MKRVVVTSRSGLVAALVGGVLGGAIALLAAGRVWAAHTFTAAGGGTQHVVVRGHDVAAALPAIATAAIALSAALLATRSWLRRGIGLLIVVVGGLLIGVSIASRGDVSTELVHRAFGVTNSAVKVPASVWPWVAAIGGVLVVVAGAMAVMFGNSWPGLGRRYDAPAVAVDDDEASVWSALDRGEDPTE